MINTHHVDHVVNVNEGIVDGNDLDLRLLKRGPEDETPNASKSIDSNFDNLFVVQVARFSKTE